MTFLDTEMEELCRSIQISTDNTRSLISTPVYVSDILQTEEAFMVKEYIHTHIHTYIHTHTHTHTQSAYFDQSLFMSLPS